MNLDLLNEWQLEAVKTVDGPLLILAGAGSGKTRVLTYRVAYLINECNIDPYNVLAITFTNKAAKEMKDRIMGILGPRAYSIQISTFHALGVLIIKENYEKAGYKANFTILDSDDSLTLIKKILKDLNLDPKIYNPKAIRNQISGAKNGLLSAKEYDKFANTSSSIASSSSAIRSSNLPARSLSMGNASRARSWSTASPARACRPL